MSKLLWSDDYSVHIASIDNAHKILVALVNEFSIALDIQGTVQRQLVIDALKILSLYIQQHFASEERFLLLNNYPGLEAHKKEHSLLLQQLDQFKQRFQANKHAFNEKMLFFLKDWLVRHIILDDCKFGHFFLGKELVI